MTKKQTTDVDPVDEIKSTLSFIAWFVIGILLGVVIIGIAGYVALNDKTDAIIDARNEARFTTCARNNQIREEAIHASQLKATDLVMKAGQDPAAELPASFIKSQGEATAAAYPKQDCRHLTEFYENPPPDPYADNCVPDSKGLCK